MSATEKVVLSILALVFGLAAFVGVLMLMAHAAAFAVGTSSWELLVPLGAVLLVCGGGLYMGLMLMLFEN